MLLCFLLAGWTTPLSKREKKLRQKQQLDEPKKESIAPLQERQQRKSPAPTRKETPAKPSKQEQENVKEEVHIATDAVETKSTPMEQRGKKERSPRNKNKVCDELGCSRV